MSDNMDEPDYDWVTADGQRLKMSEMSTMHIKNCIAMMRRQLNDRPPEAVYMGDSEFAEDAVRLENEHNERRAESLNKQIEEFEKELAIREDVRLA